MSCGCVSVDDDGAGSCYYYRDREVRAPSGTAKCSECGRPLRPLERHERVDARWEYNSGGMYRTCRDCRSIIDAFFCGGYCHTSVMEDLAEHVSDMRGEIASACFAGLTPRARRIVCDMIEDAWDDEDEEEE